MIALKSAKPPIVSIIIDNRREPERLARTIYVVRLEKA
jgi:hypothetical protein